MTTDLQSRLDQLAEAREQRQANSYERYMSLVKSTTVGADVQPDEASEILDDADRDCEDLERDCELLKRRQGWADVVGKEVANHQRSGEIEDAITRISQEKHQAVAEFNRQLKALDVERQHIQSANNGIAAALQQLRKTAWPHLQEELAACQAELQECAPTINALQSHRKAMQDSITTATRTIQLIEDKKVARPASEIESWREQLKGSQERLAECMENLGVAETTRDVILQRQAEIEARIMEP